MVQVLKAVAVLLGRWPLQTVPSDQAVESQAYGMADAVASCNTCAHAEPMRIVLRFQATI